MELEQEIAQITEALAQGQITREEHDYLVTEIRDVRAAQELAGDEKGFRYVVMAANAALGLLG